MSEKKRILKFAFLAETKEALKAVLGLERAVQQAGETAKETYKETEKASEAPAVSAKETAEAMRKLGLTLKAEAEQRVKDLEAQVAKIEQAEKQGLATMNDVRRARDRLGEQQKRWAKLTAEAVTEAIETPLERAIKKYKAFGDRLGSLAERAAPIAAAGGALLAGVGFAGAQQLDRAQMIRSATMAAGMDPANDTDLLEFQRIAAAAQVSLGFEADKTGDILKDVNDKFGDFIETGAGPLVDFFTQIGIQTGLVDKKFYESLKEKPELQLRYLQQVADSFRQGKNSIELLQAMVAEIEKTGAGAQEVAFYMEAMASDSTLYYNLLKNSSAEMNRLADRAEAAGGLFTVEQLATLQRAKEEMGLLQVAMSGLVLTLADAGFFDAFARVAQKVGEIATWVTQYISPDLLIWGGVIAAAAVALAPILFTLSKIAPLLAFIIPLFGKLSVLGGGVAALAASIGAIPIAIAAGLAAIVWTFRDEIAAVFTSIFEWIGNGLSKLAGWLSSAFGWLSSGAAADAVAVAAMPPSVGTIPAAVAQAGPRNGGTVQFDAIVNGQAIPMTAEEPAYVQLNRLLAERRATQTVRSPAYARSNP